MPYSTKELEDRALLQDALVTSIANHVAANPDGMSLVFILNIIPPLKCADGVRRAQVMDYIDYLFPSPSIEDLIATECAEFPGTTETLQLQSNTLI